MKSRHIILLGLILFEAILTPVAAEPLLGGITLQEKIAPLPSNLAPGKIADENILRSNPSDNEWFRIPTWLAGKWQNINALQLTNVNQLKAEEDPSARTINLGDQEVLGLQQDARKQIWTTETSPFFSETATNAEQKIYRSNEPVASNDDKFCLRTNDLIVTLDKKQIQSTVRRQITRCLHCLDSHTIAALYSVRTYDALGIPLDTSRQVRILSKTENFKAFDSINDCDLKGAFTKYLERTGHANLIPSRSQ